ERKPIFRVVFNDNLGVFGLNEALLALERLFFTHGPPAANRTRHAAPEHGMTRLALVPLFQRLQRVVFSLRPAGARTGVHMERNGCLAECLAVDFHHGLAELAELVGELEL